MPPALPSTELNSPGSTGAPVESPDWLGVVNAVIPYAANGRARAIQLADLDTPLGESGLDSLDAAVLGAYLCELFDVPLALQRDFHPLTLREAVAFLQQHGQRTIHSAATVHALLGPDAPRQDTP